MPSQIDKLKLPKSKDRRRRLTDNQKTKIKKLRQGGMGIRALGRHFGVSHRTIQFIIFPERLAKVKQQYKDREQHKKTYARVRGKIWRDTMREHRAYKRKVFKINKIKKHGKKNNRRRKNSNRVAR